MTRTRINRWLLWLGAILVTAVACGPDTESGGSGYVPRRRVRLPGTEGNNPTLTGVTCPSGSSLTYQNFGQGFLEQYCTSCHSRSLAEGSRGEAPLNTNFDAEGDAPVWRNSIFKVMFHKPVTMPPNAIIEESELALMKEWLRCGTP